MGVWHLLKIFIIIPLSSSSLDLFIGAHLYTDTVNFSRSICEKIKIYN